MIDFEGNKKDWEQMTRVLVWAGLSKNYQLCQYVSPSNNNATLVFS